MNSNIWLFALSFAIPFVLSLSYPLAVVFYLPRTTHPLRYVQNNPSMSIYLLSSFPTAAGVFSIAVTRQIFSHWLFHGPWKWLVLGVGIFTLVMVTAIVLTDFMSRPMAPYVLRRHEAELANQLERELRTTFQKSSHDKLLESKRRKYRKLTQLGSIGDVLGRGGPIAYIHIGLTWMGSMFAAIYFWYLVAAVEYKLELGALKEHCEDRLVLVLILLAMFFPLRLYTEWYQSYFHQKHWLQRFPLFGCSCFWQLRCPCS